MRRSRQLCAGGSRSGHAIRDRSGIAAFIGVVALVVASCGSSPSEFSTASDSTTAAESTSAAESGDGCAIVDNGTIIADETTEAETPAESMDPAESTDPAAPTTTRNISTNPEVATGYRSDMEPVRTATYSVSTANPLSTRAACEVLRDGGSAADALVAAQLVLGLVEPQSSGIGGGAFLMYYDAATGSVEAIDGRETAPAAATENYLRWIDDVNRTEPVPDTRASGRSIGVPGVLRLLETVHGAHGKLDWAAMFDPAIGIATDGFDISPRMAAAISDAAENLAADPQAREYFLQPDGSPKPAGDTLTNTAYAETLTTLAQQGPDAFYSGPIAEGIVAAAGSTANGMTPSVMTLEDLAAYRAIEREPVCSPYRDHRICGMPGPSSGGIAVAQTMGILSNFELGDYAPEDMDLNGGRPTVDGVHLIAEAERLAYADRDEYVADTDFVPLPGGSPDALLDPQYLAQRAELIDEGRSMGQAQPGEFPGTDNQGVVPTPEGGTSHISVVDSFGNAASMTTTIESGFGSFHMTNGFLLNNELTDFAAEPVAQDGAPVANRLEPGKRPRSSMAPTLVFDNPAEGSTDPVGPLAMVVGSPGGSVIIQFVVKTLTGVLDWGMDPQQAVSGVDFGAANTPVTNVGGEHPNIDAADNGDNDPLVQGLRERGHEVSVADQSSGLSALQRTDDGWIGGADPRREGLVMGDVTG